MQLYTFKNYSGFMVNGVVPMPDLNGDDNINHVKRAAWLTAHVESGGMFGTVISYDGTGVTACLHQAIAVYPSEMKEEDGNALDDQGPLWKILSRMRMVSPRLPLFEKIDSVGWVLTQDGTLRYKNIGKCVPGSNIRVEFNGSQLGITPSRGVSRKNSEEWIGLFVDAFSYPVTFPMQIQIGEEHIVKRATRVPCRYSKNKIVSNKTIQEVVYTDPISVTRIGLSGITPGLDLAMCMFWSNTVNAPGQSLRVLCRVLDLLSTLHAGTSQWEMEFSRLLIRALGNTSFGRWDDDLPNGRYQRTRSIALESGLWPEDLFVGKDAIMPKDLPG